MKLNFDELIKWKIIFLRHEGLNDDDDLNVLYKVIEQSTVLEELHLNNNMLTLTMASWQRQLQEYDD